MGGWCTNKDVNKLIRKLLREGWELREGKRHIVLKAPTGATVSISRSPSDYFAFKNILGDIRRASTGQTTGNRALEDGAESPVRGIAGTDGKDEH